MAGEMVEVAAEKDSADSAAGTATPKGEEATAVEVQVENETCSVP